MRIVDAGADWTPGSFLAMTVGVAILLEISIIVITGQIIVLGAAGLVIAFSLMRLIWTKLGPRGEFSTGTPIDLGAAGRTVTAGRPRSGSQEETASGGSYPGISCGVEEPRALAALFRAGALRGRGSGG
jgi:hypothetical protein